MTGPNARSAARSGYAAARLLIAKLFPGATPLTAFNAVMPKERGAARIVHDAAFGTHPRQRIDVYAPRRRRGGPLPLILFLYGGSWRSGTKHGYAFVARAIAARGFVVGVPDYRLVPEHPFPDFLHDNADAFRWLRDAASAFGGDPDRVVIAGHSAGAYNAAMLAMDARWLGDDRRFVRGWSGLSGPYDFLPLKGSIARGAFAHWPDPHDTQPIRFAHANAPPALIATGADDAMVLPSNGAALAARLRAAGAPVEERVYPRVGHVGAITAFARPLRMRAPVLRDLIAFAHRVTGPDFCGTPWVSGGSTVTP